jgi:hypothetical protein
MKTRFVTQLIILALGVFCVCVWLFAARPYSDVVKAYAITLNSMASTPPPPYLEYQVYGGSVITDSTMPPVLPNGQADYAQIYAEHNLCSLITKNQIDEVWIWAGNGDGVSKGHMWEWTTSGPGWYGAAPDCGKVATTMTFNYLREVDVALESFNHRLEGFFGHYFACDFSTATWPWAGSTTWPYNQCGSLLSDRYGFVARPFAGNNQIGGCGDAHHPPNILDNREYIYNDTTTVGTICPSWSQDDSSITTNLNCQAWGCTHWGFHVWWMQNVPGLNNTNKDRNGNLHPNWWAYLFGIPSKQFQVYLPVVLYQQTGSSRAMIQYPPSIKSMPKQDYATVASREELSPIEEPKRIALHSATSLASKPPTTTRTVYVLYYPGYGGTPRANVNLLTKELIGLLKEATVYHGYNYATLRGTFLGQDGQSYAGRGCAIGDAPDNIHIHLDGLRTDAQVTTYQVEDPSGGGRWATPCNPVSSWLLHVVSDTTGQADLYFKPFRDAPDGTQYMISVQYGDGLSESVTVVGSRVQTLVASFVGQDGYSYAGQGCTTGSVPDNVHIRLRGIRSGFQPTSYRVDDLAGGGVWAIPCNPISNWLLHVISVSPDQTDLYFKPFRDAPDGTVYTISVQYNDGASQTTTVEGTRVTP